MAIYSPFASVYYARRTDQAPGGGAELQSSLLARGLAKRGLRVAHIVYPIPEPIRFEPPSPTLVERARHRGGGGLGWLAEGRAIWRGLDRADASVCVVRGSGGHLMPAAAFSRSHRRRLVFSTSNDLDFDFERHDRNRLILRGYRYSIRGADRVVVQTRQQERLARQALPRVEPVVIPSFAEAAEPVSGEPEYFLWADRLVEYKQPERCLELAAALPEARFRMVGQPTSETPPGLKRRVEERARSLPNVELVSPRPREQLLAEMSRAAAVVTTSRAEGMPNTFLEAWARGIPALSLGFDPDGLIAGNRIGIAAGGSMERLIEGARTLWQDGGVRKEMGDSARELVRSTHSPDAVAERWLALIEGLLDG